MKVEDRLEYQLKSAEMALAKAKKIIIRLKEEELEPAVQEALIAQAEIFLGWALKGTNYLDKMLKKK